MPTPPTPTPTANRVTAVRPVPDDRPRGLLTGLAAAFAGWLLPGLGHLLTGHLARGLTLGITLGTLWLGGLLIGGLSVVDRQGDPAWFLGQALLAPSLAADHYRGARVAEHRAKQPPGRMVPADAPPFEPSFGRARELGTLYTSLAGLLNLLAMLDVVYRPSPRRRPDPAAANPSSPTAKEVA